MHIHTLSTLYRLQGSGSKSAVCSCPEIHLINSESKNNLRGGHWMRCDFGKLQYFRKGQDGGRRSMHAGFLAYRQVNINLDRFIVTSTGLQRQYHALPASAVHRFLAVQSRRVLNHRENPYDIWPCAYALCSPITSARVMTPNLLARFNRHHYHCRHWKRVWRDARI